MNKASALTKILFWLYLPFFLVACSKTPVYFFPEILSDSIYTGSVWITIEVNKRKKQEFNTVYGDFQLSTKFFYLRLKDPFGTTLGVLVWNTEEKEQIKIYDLYHHKILVISFSKGFNPKDLPQYFLGIKEKEKTWEVPNHGIIKYGFNKNSGQGKVKFEVKGLEVSWKFKSLNSVNELLWDPAFYQKHLEKEGQKELLQF
ncbi:hypothetical protein [Thermodesulfobacterium hveragerdense]|uniref:hypothetical protein n=1 Tax=Thermodesulfobacterium hveragerdense TaxID=53424 RepID=UPI00048F8C6A|nr:hypothetical protein [Thermodesulfobacterium hveragerdense]